MSPESPAWLLSFLSVTSIIIGVPLVTRQSLLEAAQYKLLVCDTFSEPAKRSWLLFTWCRGAGALHWLCVVVVPAVGHLQVISS